ncbi:hypothetical protein CHUAL_010251 [Chamberlinius hualienensis]
MAMTPTTFFTVTVPLALMSFLLTLLFISDGLLVISNGGSFGVSAAYAGAVAAPPASSGNPSVRSGSGRAGGIPLVGEDTNNRRRKGKKNTDCHFGRTKYELGETWHPDLGPPFGVLSCVECECVSVQKRRRIVGRVKCRNTKNECPEPNCEDPVLLTGRCCKTCPENEIQMEQKPKDETDKSGHEYASLMTSDAETIASTTSTHINAAASGRFVLHKRNLHYSIHYIGNLRPTHVAFTDEKGHIIEDQLITHITLLQNSSYKICGVWLKVPKYYREPLTNEELFVKLLFKISVEVDIVAGRLTKYMSAALKKETFSTLLTPSGNSDGDSRSWMTKPSGMAIISTSSVNGAVHFYIVLKNMLTDRGKDQMVSVRLESLHKDDVDAVVIEETFVMAEIVKDSVVAQLKMDFDAKVFRQMARGKLLLSVTSKQNVDSNKISGLISPKVSCTVYHSILSVAADEELGLNPATTGAGQVVMRLTSDGSIIYKIQTEGIHGAVTYVGLETLNKKRFRPVHNLTLSYKDGWANGTLNRLSARDIELLTSAELHVVIGSDLHPIHLTGQVKQRLFGEAQSGDFFPLLLRGGNGPAAGQAWMAVDDTCRLYYEVVVGNQQQFQQLQSNKKLHGGRGKDLIDEVGIVELVDIGVLPDDRTSSYTRELDIRQEFTGNEVEDVAEDISNAAFARLEAGNAILHVSINSTVSGNVSRIDLRARVNNLRIPITCLPDKSQNEVPLVSISNTYEPLDDPDEGGEPPNGDYRCAYEGRRVDDGSHWTQSYNSCVICSCRRGNVICESTVCPALSCPNAKIPNGECCPVCSEIHSKAPPFNTSNRGCYFDGDKKFHKPGSKWYPYLPPFGFSQCALCTCNATTLTVNCTKIICKSLSCPEKDAYRKNPKDCCKTCPDSPVTPVDGNSPTEPNDEGHQNNNNEIISVGGCKLNGETMPNGEEWHPRVQPFGHISCVRCNCKDGRTTCKRLKCPPTNCHNKINNENECCPRCADGPSSALSSYGRSKTKPPSQ